jgi:hypothetical protein
MSILRNNPRIQIKRLFVKTSFFDIITQVVFNKRPMNSNQTNNPRIPIERMFVETSFFDIITQGVY